MATNIIQTNYLNLFGTHTSSLMVLTLFILLFIIVKYLKSNFGRDPRLVEFAKTIPGPPTLPLLGNGLDFVLAGPNVLNKILGYIEKYGTIYRLWFGKYLVIVLSDVEDLEAVFQSSKMLGKPRIFEPFRDIFGEGMSTTKSTNIWRTTRKLQEPSFRKNTLPEYVPLINEKIHKGMEAMEQLVDSSQFDMLEYASNIAFDIVVKMVFDIDIDANDKRTLEFHTCIQTAFETSYLRMLRPWLHVKPICDFFFGKKITKVRRKMWQFIEQELAHKIDLLRRAVEQDDLDNISGSPSLVPRMLLATYRSQLLTGRETQTREEILTLITGGTGTIATAVSFCLMALAANPDIQDKLYDELYDVFGNSDESAQADHLTQLPYLDQVVEETMRRYPPGPGIFRNVEEDVKIGSRVIPADTALLLLVVGVHMNPKNYPNPEKFNPENFSPEAVAERHRLAYLPFGAGPRNCIANNFSYLEMKLIVIALVRKFSFHTTVKLEDLKLLMTLSLSSIDGYKMSVRLRNHRHC